jgi:hypothetical protein
VRLNKDQPFLDLFPFDPMSRFVIDTTVWILEYLGTEFSNERVHELALFRSARRNRELNGGHHVAKSFLDSSPNSIPGSNGDVHVQEFFGHQVGELLPALSFGERRGSNAGRYAGVER